MKIRTRIILGYLLLFSAGFFYLTRFALEDIKLYHLQSMEESLVDTANILSSNISTGINNGQMQLERIDESFEDAYKKSFQIQIYKYEKKNVDLRVYITNDKGIVLYDSKDKDKGKDYSRWNDVYITLKGRYGSRATWEKTEEGKDVLVLYVASPIIVDDKIVGVLTVCKPTSSTDFLVKTGKDKLIQFAIIAALIIFISGILFSTWVTRPIKSLIQYVRDVRDGKRVDLPPLGKSEIGKLAEKFDEMREALEGKKYVENYVQTLTHEIKSPLSAIKGAAELLDEGMEPEMRRKFMNNIKSEVQRTQDIIDRLLELSALESRKNLNDAVDAKLVDIIKETIDTKRPSLAAKSLQLKSEFDVEATILADEFLLGLAFSNLLQNAIEFSPVNGDIKIDLEKTENEICIKIQDSGPGIPDYAHEKIFERFYSLPRPDSGKKSSGLGLSLVKEILKLHNGSIELKNSENSGAIAVVRLPIISS